MRCAQKPQNNNWVKIREITCQKIKAICQKVQLASKALKNRANTRMHITKWPFLQVYFGYLESHH